MASNIPGLTEADIADLRSTFGGAEPKAEPLDVMDLTDGDSGDNPKSGVTPFRGRGFGTEETSTTIGMLQSAFSREQLQGGSIKRNPNGLTIHRGRDAVDFQKADGSDYGDYLISQGLAVPTLHGGSNSSRNKQQLFYNRSNELALQAITGGDPNVLPTDDMSESAVVVRNAYQAQVEEALSEQAFEEARSREGVFGRAYYEDNTGRAWERGKQEVKMLLSGTTKLLGDIFGVEAVSRYGEQGMLTALRKTSYVPAEVQSLEEVEWNNVHTYIWETLVAEAPSMLMDLALATTGVGLGAVAGKKIITKSGELAIKSLVKDLGREQAQKQVTDIAMKKAATIGGKFLGAASMGAQQFGEAELALYQQGVDTSEKGAGTALALGAITTALDLVLPATVLKRLTAGINTPRVKWRSIAKDVIKNGVAKGMPLEFITEALQEATTTLGSYAEAGKLDQFGEAELKGILEAGVQGLIAGGGVTTAIEAAVGIANKTNGQVFTPEPKEQISDQIELAFGPNEAAKDSVIVTAEQGDEAYNEAQARHKEVAPGADDLIRVDGGGRTLITSSQEKADLFDAENDDNDSRILGYAQNKTEVLDALDQGAEIGAIQGVNDEGRVVTDQAVDLGNEQAVEAAKNSIASDGLKIRVVTPEQNNQERVNRSAIEVKKREEAAAKAAKAKVIKAVNSRTGEIVETVAAEDIKKNPDKEAAQQRAVDNIKDPAEDLAQESATSETTNVMGEELPKEQASQFVRKDGGSKGVSAIRAAFGNSRARLAAFASRFDIATEGTKSDTNERVNIPIDMLAQDIHVAINKAAGIKDTTNEITPQVAEKQRVARAKIQTKARKDLKIVLKGMPKEIAKEARKAIKDIRKEASDKRKKVDNVALLKHIRNRFNVDQAEAQIDREVRKGLEPTDNTEAALSAADIELEDNQSDQAALRSFYDLAAGVTKGFLNISERDVETFIDTFTKSIQSYDNYDGTYQNLRNMFREVVRLNRAIASGKSTKATIEKAKADLELLEGTPEMKAFRKHADKFLAVEAQSVTSDVLEAYNKTVSDKDPKAQVALEQQRQDLIGTIFILSEGEQTPKRKEHIEKFKKELAEVTRRIESARYFKGEELFQGVRVKHILAAQAFIDLAQTIKDAGPITVSDGKITVGDRVRDAFTRGSALGILERNKNTSSARTIVDAESVSTSGSTVINDGSGGSLTLVPDVAEEFVDPTGSIETVLEKILPEKVMGLLDLSKLKDEETATRVLEELISLLEAPVVGGPSPESLAAAIESILKTRPREQKPTVTIEKQKELDTEAVLKSLFSAISAMDSDSALLQEQVRKEFDKDGKTMENIQAAPLVALLEFISTPNGKAAWNEYQRTRFNDLRDYRHLNISHGGDFNVGGGEFTSHEYGPNRALVKGFMNYVRHQHATTSDPSLGTPKGRFIRVGINPKVFGGETDSTKNDNRYPLFIAELYRELSNEGLLSPVTVAAAKQNLGGSWDTATVTERNVAVIKEVLGDATPTTHMVIDTVYLTEIGHQFITADKASNGQDQTIATPSDLLRSFYAGLFVMREALSGNVVDRLIEEFSAIGRGTPITVTKKRARVGDQSRVIDPIDTDIILKQTSDGTVTLRYAQGVVTDSQMLEDHESVGKSDMAVVEGTRLEKSLQQTKERVKTEMAARAKNLHVMLSNKPSEVERTVIQRELDLLEYYLAPEEVLTAQERLEKSEGTESYHKEAVTEARKALRALNKQLRAAESAVAILDAGGKAKESHKGMSLAELTAVRDSLRLEVGTVSTSIKDAEAELNQFGRIVSYAKLMKPIREAGEKFNGTFTGPEGHRNSIPSTTWRLVETYRGVRSSLDMLTVERSIANIGSRRDGFTGNQYTVIQFGEGGTGKEITGTVPELLKQGVSGSSLLLQLRGTDSYVRRTEEKLESWGYGDIDPSEIESKALEERIANEVTELRRISRFNSDERNFDQPAPDTKEQNAVDVLVRTIKNLARGDKNAAGIYTGAVGWGDKLRSVVGKYLKVEGSPLRAVMLLSVEEFDILASRGAAPISDIVQQAVDNVRSGKSIAEHATVKSQDGGRNVFVIVESDEQLKTRLKTIAPEGVKVTKARLETFKSLVIGHELGHEYVDSFLAATLKAGALDGAMEAAQKAYKASENTGSFDEFLADQFSSFVAEEMEIEAEQAMTKAGIKDANAWLVRMQKLMQESQSKAAEAQAYLDGDTTGAFAQEYQFSLNERIYSLDSFENYAERRTEQEAQEERENHSRDKYVQEIRDSESERLRLSKIAQKIVDSADDKLISQAEESNEKQALVKSLKKALSNAVMTAKVMLRRMAAELGLKRFVLIGSMRNLFQKSEEFRQARLAAEQVAIAERLKNKDGVSEDLIRKSIVSVLAESHIDSEVTDSGLSFATPEQRDVALSVTNNMLAGMNEAKGFVAMATAGNGIVLVKVDPNVNKAFTVAEQRTNAQVVKQAAAKIFKGAAGLGQNFTTSLNQLYDIAGAEFAEKIGHAAGTANTNNTGQSAVIEAIQRTTNEWLNRFVKIVPKSKDQLEVLAAVRSGDLSTKEAKRVQEVLVNFHKLYITKGMKSNPVISEGRFPMILAEDALGDEKFGNFMAKKGITDTEIVNRIRMNLLNHKGVLDYIPTYGFPSSVVRTLQGITAEELEAAGLLEIDDTAALHSFVWSAVSRVEMEKRFGGYVRPSNGSALSTPEAVAKAFGMEPGDSIDHLLDSGQVIDTDLGYLVFDADALIKAKRAEIAATDPAKARTFDRIVDTNLGRNRPEISDGWRKTNSWVIAYQAVTKLMFAMPASTVELGGGVLKAQTIGGMVKAVFQTAAFPLDYSRRMEWMRAMGVITQGIENSALASGMQLNDMARMPKKVMEKFFFYNGLKAFTDMSRAAAGWVGRGFIMDHINSSDNNSVRWMADLNLVGERKAAAQRWLGSDQFEHGLSMELLEADPQLYADGVVFAEAIKRYTDMSAVMPDSTSNAPWMNDPRFAMLTFLRPFQMAYVTRIIGGVLRESKARYGDTENAYRHAYAAIPIVAAGTFLLPLAALGIALRDGIKGLGDDDDKETYYQRLSGKEKLWALVKRTGGLGPFESAINFVEDEDWKGNRFLNFLGVVPADIGRFVADPGLFSFGLSDSGRSVGLEKSVFKGMIPGGQLPVVQEYTTEALPEGIWARGGG